ncbi:MAG: NAD(P)-binding domain-containing protein [Burkholderiales bacterium]|nr:NAD(P)-binding domain-containing protein [Burkholderiales bacterium]
MVGQALASKLASIGHDVMMGARSAGNDKAAAWAAAHQGKVGSFADAARHGEVVINATLGGAALDALRAAGAANLAGKVLIDVANPLDFSRGMPPSRSIVNTDPLGEAVQREFPHARVVKTLNTMSCMVMVDPARVPGVHHVFVSGNDAAAKATARGLLGEFGWAAERIVDLGDITTTRGTEQLLPIWIRPWGALGTPDFNFAIVKA